MILEKRKEKEVEHSDRRRSIVKGYEYETDATAGQTGVVADQQNYEQHFSNMKFYSISRSSFAYRDACLFKGIENATALDFCCGNGEVGIEMAKHGAAKVYGIDLSSVAIANAQELAAKAGVADRCHFQVMDAEKMEFPDSTFDIVHEYGALHHLELKSAFKELARVLKPSGTFICTEALRHNPFIHLYRKMTPHLRTDWEVEHILGVPEIHSGKAFFGNLDIRFFHMLSLAAVPFRKAPFFDKLLKLLERMDDTILNLPLIQRWAWVAVFKLSNPKK